MKQVVQDLRSGHPDVLDVPVPKPTAGTALIRTVASFVSAGTERTLIEFASKGMLGKAMARPDLVRQTLEKVRQEGLLTTLQAVRGRLDQPLPLGYSSAGIVVEVGPDMEGVRPGDRVACAGGGHAVHAEYAVVPENLLAPLPQAVDFESGAAATLGAIALHAFRLSEAQVGERVAVIGLGLLGQVSMQIARAAGCEALGVDIDENRVALARQLGGSAVPREEAGGALGSSFDAVLICAHTADSDPLILAAQLARDRGRVVLVGTVGMELPRKAYYDKELSFMISRSYGPGRYDPSYEENGIDYPIGYVRWTEKRNIEAFLELVAAGKVQLQPLITHRFPIERAEAAYELITNGENQNDKPPLGILLTYPEDAPRERKIILDASKVRGDTLLTVGALGAGNFARNVAFPVLKRLDDVELVGLAAASGFSSADAAGRFGFSYATTEAEEIIMDDAINAIAVFTRHHLHADQTRRALEAGKHVFCEKPLAIDQAGLDSVVAAMADSATLLGVGFNRRFAPLGIKMRQFLSLAGEPLSLHYRINAGALPLDHWAHDPAQGGGRIIGEVCHFIDFLTFLVGSVPTQLRARALPDQGKYLGDNVHITMEFPDGSIGSIDYLASGDRSFPKERVEAFGGGRVAVLEDFRSLELVGAGRTRRHGRRGRQDKGHTAIWEAFVDAVRAGGPPPISYGELVLVTQATFAAIESLSTGLAVELEPG